MKFGTLEIVDGKETLTNVGFANSFEEFTRNKRVAGLIDSGLAFIEIAANVKEGAQRNADGTFTNPVTLEPEPATEPAILSKPALLVHARAQLGNSGRVNAILEEGRNSPDEDTRFSLNVFDATTAGLEREEVRNLLAALIIDPAVSLTQAEADKILNSWPTA